MENKGAVLEKSTQINRELLIFKPNNYKQISNINHFNF